MSNENTPSAIFEGYVDGMPRITWCGEALPAGTVLFAAPSVERNSIIREAVEATFEARPGWMTKIAAAVRALGAAPQQVDAVQAVPEERDARYHLENLLANPMPMPMMPDVVFHTASIAHREAADKARAFLASPSPAVPPEPFDFHAHLARQAAWSEKTFGPGPRTKGVCDHIRKELGEVEADPLDLKEWVDVVILALDGAWRCGGKPDEIIAGIVAKQTKNEGRVWPDWRTADPDKAIEHDRSHDAQPTDTTAPSEGPTGLPDFSDDMLTPEEMRRHVARRLRERCKHEYLHSSSLGGEVCSKCGKVKPTDTTMGE